MKKKSKQSSTRNTFVPAMNKSRKGGEMKNKKDKRANKIQQESESFLDHLELQEDFCEEDDFSLEDKIE